MEHAFILGLIAKVVTIARQTPFTRLESHRMLQALKSNVSSPTDTHASAMLLTLMNEPRHRRIKTYPLAKGLSPVDLLFEFWQSESCHRFVLDPVLPA
jgi:hypothetical protein